MVFLKYAETHWPRISWPPISFLIPSLYPHSLILEQTTSLHTLFPLVPKETCGFITPSLHSHLCSNILSSNRSSMRTQYKDPIPILCLVLWISRTLTPPCYYVFISLSAVFVFLESAPHQSESLVCLTHCFNASAPSHGPQ